MAKGDLRNIDGTLFIEDESGYLMTWEGIEEETSTDNQEIHSIEKEEEANKIYNFYTS